MATPCELAEAGSGTSSEPAPPLAVPRYSTAEWLSGCARARCGRAWVPAATSATPKAVTMWDCAATPLWAAALATPVFAGCELL